ncbi:DUF4296 domain-containing protein [Flavobacterium akiainvivens]|uniref:DUF4296 domain-containing protein n=1 Tax=Flavobacterium akiainvivens TaxID=1202724 RepID=UPI0006C8A379|nr:DUF4296 domain-containing protein [Flavobacterium akiainvivens]SFQ70492.1 protein of unknown function [Flavobacterium akiainvivens]
MKKTASIIISAVLLAACGGPEKPKKLLSQQEMENITYDISLLQAIRSFAPQKLTDNNVEAHTYIYKKYKIDSLTLAQNQMYYAQDLETFKKIQQSVAERLKADKTKASPKDKTTAPATATTPPAQVAVPPQKTSPAPNVPVQTPEQKAIAKHKRDSVRAAAEKKLKRAPLHKVKQE